MIEEVAIKDEELCVKLRRTHRAKMLNEVSNEKAFFHLINCIGIGYSRTVAVLF